MSSSLLNAAAKLTYEVSIPAPHTHYFEVKMIVEGWDSTQLDLKLPVWTPGSYLVREYARNIESFQANDEKGRTLNASKTNKNTWQITQDKAGKVFIRYAVYSFELSVRTCYLDDTYGYISGAGLFMYVANHLDLPAEVQIFPPSHWQKVSTALPAIRGQSFRFSCPDYDTLVDSPILIGNQEEYAFEASGVPHRLAIQRPANVDAISLLRDLKTISEATARIIDDVHPCKDYLYIVLSSESMKGGLEHLNSTTLIYPSWGYTADKYFDFLSLACHEYFHLWNVKRIRPIELGPFNYDEENYTSQLWIAEGFTSYYDELIPLRAGFIKGGEYLKKLESKINGVESLPGNQIQSLAEASLDAWIKYYRRNENSDNCCVSYYDKGALVALTLDFMIRKNTGNEQKLDDVLKQLWKKYFVAQNRGFTEEEFLITLNEVSGKDFTDELDKYVYNCEGLPYEQVLAYAGVEVKKEPLVDNLPYLGATVTIGNGKFVINKVIRGSCAYNDGLYVNDEVLAINNFRLSADPNEEVKKYKVGDKLVFLVARGGQIRTVEIQLDYNRTPVYKLAKMGNATEVQKYFYSSWTGEKFDLNGL